MFLDVTALPQGAVHRPESGLGWTTQKNVTKLAKPLYTSSSASATSVPSDGLPPHSLRPLRHAVQSQRDPNGFTSWDGRGSRYAYQILMRTLQHDCRESGAHAMHTFGELQTSTRGGCTQDQKSSDCTCDATAHQQLQPSLTIGCRMWSLHASRLVNTIQKEFAHQTLQTIRPIALRLRQRVPPAMHQRSKAGRG